MCFVINGARSRDGRGAAFAPTTSVLAAGSDEVSATNALVFDARATRFQALGAQAVAFHTQFVPNLCGTPGAPGIID